MSAKKPRITFQVGRDASTGQFMAVARAQKFPRLSTVETVPLAGAAKASHEQRLRGRRRKRKTVTYVFGPGC